MRGSFVLNIFQKNTMVRRGICVCAALMSAVCLLSACGPEPGAGSGGVQTVGGSMFGGQDSGAGTEPAAGGEGGTEAATRDATDGISDQHMQNPGDGTAEAGSTKAAESAAAAGTAGGGESALPRPIQGDVKQSDAQTLEALEKYLNEDSSYGFLLSSYETPAEIDLNQVFYSGAGFAQEELTDKEKELLLDRIPQTEIRTPVVKVTDEQIEELLSSKAGIAYEDSAHPLDQKDGWARIRRTGAWYALRGDTNRKYIQCTDAWEQENTIIVHYRLILQKTPASAATEADHEAETAADTAAESKTETAAANGETAEAATGATSAAAETAETAESAAVEETAATAATAAATEATSAAAETTESTAVEEAATAAATEATSAAAETAEITAAEETASAAATTAAAETAESAAAEETAVTEGKNALYRPTYEVQLEKTEEGYRFCYNILWLQKDLIEAQSYKAELKPVGEVFFAPFYPDTEQDERADVTFVLEKDRAIESILSPMETNNIRTDLVFNSVDAVDFTDYNGDGYTDILTVCSYTRFSTDGKKIGSMREARVYTGQNYGVPFLDREKTEAVNRDVEVLNITNVTDYLTGKNDGSAKKYATWKEAFADRIEGIAEDEYDGFALIYLNDDRTPELVQMGATTAKGATVVVYRNGTLEETWLNRRDFYYLEYENLLYSPSGVENLHFDTYYSIVGGRLGISSQGYYGNSSFARARFDRNGKEIYDYFWDGGEVSENGYQDGIAFMFDMSRAKSCEADQLMTAAELMEKLK